MLKSTENDLPFKPCAIIPVFNHQDKISAVALRVHERGLPCILVDDGSSAACALTLDSLAQAHSWIHLIRLAENSGKGAAVCAGFRFAHQQGYSHALQVDADGQHDLDDLPTFLAQGQKEPTAVICGWRGYNAMPPARRFGRKITDFWVNIHTLSAQIKDSMCGFRLYPLTPTIALLDASSIGARMNFDTDILVRLYWQGLPVINIPTRIIYDDDIPSHFDAVKDNIRICWMHTRLFFGMLPKVFFLLRRRRY